jgi:FkbM family methyltransferase
MLRTESCILTNAPRTYLSIKPPYVPFKVRQLPLISQLKNIGFHKYKTRWAKRLGKKVGRLIFDIAYHHLKLSGEAEVSVQFDGQIRKFLFDARTLHFSRLYDKQIYNLCEPELATLLELFLTGDMVFYDIGSNWGYFSLYASSLPNYHGHIHAFEPIEKTFADLQDWVKQLGQENRVTSHKVALSDANGTAQIGIFPGDSGLSSLARAEDLNIEKMEVQTCCLDNLKIPKPDFIKLDVEGYEYQVIQGALDTLLTNKPMIVFESWIDKENPEHTLLPIKALLNHGYKLFVPMWQIGPPTNEMYWPVSNYIFPEGPKRIAYVEFYINTRFNLRDQINFFCCHEDRLIELDAKFDV